MDKDTRAGIIEEYSTIQIMDVSLEAKVRLLGLVDEAVANYGELAKYQESTEDAILRLDRAQRSQIEELKKTSSLLERIKRGILALTALVTKRDGSIDA